MSIANYVLTAGDGPAAVSFNLAAAVKSGTSSGKSTVLVPAHEGREHALLILVRPPIIGQKTDSGFEVWLLVNTQASKFAPTPGHP